MNWFPLSGVASYGVEVDLLSVNRYFDEIDNLSCTGINLQLDSSVSSLHRSGCNWRGPYFSPYTKHGFTVNAYDSNGNLLATSTDNATVSVNKPSPPLEVWGTVGNAEVSIEWDSVRNATGYKVYTSVSNNYSDITSDDEDTSDTKATFIGLTNGNEYEYRIRTVTSDGESALSNPVKLTPSYGRDLFLVKYNSSGTKQWTKQYGTSSDEWVNDVETDSLGNIYLTGFTNRGLDGNKNQGGNDLYLIKYNSSGTKQWIRQIGSIWSDYGESISTDSSGNIFVGGSTVGGLEGNTNKGKFDVFAIKFDQIGTKQETYQTGSSSFNYLESIKIDSFGNLYVAGYTYGEVDNKTNLGSSDVFTGKLKWSNKDSLWTRQLGTASWDIAKEIAVDSSGNVYVTGNTEGDLDGNTNAGKEDVFLVKYNSSGTKQWTKLIGTPTHDYVEGISVDLTGNIYIAGWTYGNLDNNTNAGSYDLYLIKYNSDGERQWTKQLGTSTSEGAYGIDSDSFGNVYVTGWTYGDLDGNTSEGQSDLFLSKYNSSGTKQWTKQLGTSFQDWANDVTTDTLGNIYVTGVTAGGLDGYRNAGRESVALEIDNVTANQSVQVDFSDNSQPKLITGKPGIIRAFFRLSGNINGYLGTIRLIGAGSISSVIPITQTLAIHETPKSSADESNCVATFDLRSLASSWFKPGAEIVLETSPGTTLDQSNSNYVRYPSTGSQKLTVVDQEPLYIKLVPLQTDQGKLTSSEMNAAKTKIQTLMNSMYPNSSITFVVSDTAYDLTGNKYSGSIVTSDEWSEGLKDFASYRELELNNTNCSRFYFGLLRYQKDTDYSFAGLARRITSVESGFCPHLSSIGLNHKEVDETAAHEIGHNHGRMHADNTGETNDSCSEIKYLDSSYPYQYGRLGKMGYDSSEHSLKSKYFDHDVMSYCDKAWISDYTYTGLRKFQETLNKNVASTAARTIGSRIATVAAGGTLISGIKNTNGGWVIDSILRLGGTRSQPKNPTHFMTTQTQSGVFFTQGFVLGWFDHVLDRPFSVWIPTSEPLKNLKILNAEEDLLYQKDLPKLSESALRGEGIKLVKIAKDKWQLSPTNQGRCIVMLIRNSERKFVGNDSDDKPLVIEAIEGDKLEIHYPDTGAKQILIVE